MRPNQPVTRPFIRLTPNRLEPFVLTCEHARGQLPKGVRANAAERSVLRSHFGSDIGAWELTREAASRLGTGATGGRWSRLWIDLNRGAGDPMLVRAEAEGQRLGWNQCIGAPEIARRYREVHTPYHNEIDREIVHRLTHGVRPVLLAIHTFTPVWNGRPRRFDAGVLYDENRREATQLVAALREAGLEVRYNQPYSGKRGLMYSIDRHGRQHRLPCLELEINQALFARRGTAARLGRVVAGGLHEIETALRGQR